MMIEEEDFTPNQQKWAEENGFKVHNSRWIEVDGEIEILFEQYAQLHRYFEKKKRFYTQERARRPIPQPELG